MTHRLVVSLGCFLTCLPGLSAGDWPGWRGPLGTGVADEKGLPVRWSATEGIRWKVPLAGNGASSPTVSGDRVFLTASDGRASDQLHVYAFDRATGRLVWHRRFFGSAQPEGQFGPGGMAVPTACTDGQRVYTLFGTGDLICLDWEGRPVWIRSLAEEYGPFRNRWGMGASPILVNGMVVVQVDHWGQSYLLAVDAKTGANRWKTLREASVNWSSPVAVRVGGRTQIITTGTYRVKGYDADSGAELWTVSGLMMQCIPTPVVHQGLAYAVSGRRGDTLAIRLDENARGDLTASHVVWKKSRGAPFVPSGLCYGREYYLVDDNGMATCLDAATGELRWQERLGGKFHASPVAGDGKIYFGSLEGTVTVIEASPKFNLLSRNQLGEGIIAGLALAGGNIFVRTEKHLYCIGPDH
ncbi:MAG: PQQ-binding-like beta-propeller repeat protein [Gemmataceae bacterium]|nr:PQQ-binding-like beta-propeller repeat protein [Gemmataceae bacterium]MDW8265970.1 PQQ-binding-like beta-propeller repeat protein [Gemmataceae bacterium]